MKYINKILLTTFIFSILLLSENYSASANISNNRDFSNYIKTTSYKKSQSNSYEVIKLNDSIIPEGEEDEIITINPSLDNTSSDNIDNNYNSENSSLEQNNLDNTNNKNLDNTNNKTEDTSLETNTAENVSSETSSANSNLETSTSSPLTDETSTVSNNLTESIDETQTATPSVSSLHKNSNNSSSGSNNTSEESLNKFDLAVSNLMVFLVLMAILLYKFSPKVKALIKLMTLDKDEV